MTKNRFTNLEGASQRGSAQPDEQVSVSAPETGEISTALKEELRVTSPILARLATPPPALSPAEWSQFQEELRREIHTGPTNPRRTWRDKLSASDNKLARFFAAVILFNR